jgi:hypothetical protein
MQGQLEASNNPHTLPSPSPNQSSRPPRWWHLCGCHVWETCCEIFCEILVVRYFLLNLFVKPLRDTWWDLWLWNLFDVVKFVRYMVLVIHVLILWYMWCQWYISFVWLDGITKTNKKWVFLVTLPSVTLGKETLYRHSAKKAHLGTGKASLPSVGV